jgi:hypothetical protein
MYCSNCGLLNENTNKFCPACGYTLFRATVPPPAPITNAVSIPAKPSRPYKTQFVLGLIASMISTIAFMILLIVAMLLILMSYSFDEDALSVLIASLAVLASSILGYIGISQLKRTKGTGGIYLIIAGLLSIGAIIIVPDVGWITAFFFPLFLVGGIMALARRARVERDKHKSD